MERRLDELGRRLQLIMNRDCVTLVEKEREYGRSWMTRGGIGAFMMLARKWDRLQNAVSKPLPLFNCERYDIFQHIAKDKRAEGILDDIRDLRNYLFLVEEEMMARGVIDDITWKKDPFAGVGGAAKAETIDSTGMQHPFGFDEEQDIV